MQKHIKTKFLNQQVVFAFSQYQADKSTAVTLHDLSGDRAATATTCLMDYGMKPKSDRHIFVKAYSENELMLEGLLIAGVVRPAEPFVCYELPPYGAKVFEVELTDEAWAECRRQFAERGEG